MTARILLPGVLHKAPVRKTAKTGRPYVLATLREVNGDAMRWWKLFVFHESAIEEIERLGEGDVIAASGIFEATIWTPEGKQPRVSLSLTADAILSAKAKPKPKNERAAADDRGSARASATWLRGGTLDDEIPF